MPAAPSASPSSSRRCRSAVREPRLEVGDGGADVGADEDRLHPHGAGGVSFRDLTRDFVAIDPELRVTPDRGAKGVYDELAGRFAEKLVAAGG